MILMTDDLVEKFKENNGERVIVKFFVPNMGKAWYVYDYDPEVRIVWCYIDEGAGVSRDETPVSLSYLEKFTFNPFGKNGGVVTKVERDNWFEPCSREEVFKGGL